MNDESNVSRDTWSYGSALIFSLGIFFPPFFKFVSCEGLAPSAAQVGDQLPSFNFPAVIPLFKGEIISFCLVDLDLRQSLD